jgi:hypothetical protein
MSSTSGDRVTNFLQEVHQSSDNNEIDLCNANTPSRPGVVP